MSEETVDTSHAEAEAKARQLNWTNQEEWVAAGKDPAKWRGAEEFLEFGERLNPILRENNKRLEAQLKARDDQIAQIQREVEKFAKVHEETTKAAYAKALADLREEKKEALANQDFDAVVDIDEKIAVTKEAARPQAVQQQQPQSNIPPEIQATYNTWVSENITWLQDAELEAYAEAEGKILVKQGVPAYGDNFRPYLDKVKARVMEKFPEKFGVPPRNISRVEGGTSDNAPSPVSGKRSYGALPKEHKESCDFLCKTIAGFTREKYLETYKWDKN